jgi:hypothetical protein
VHGEPVRNNPQQSFEVPLLIITTRIPGSGKLLLVLLLLLLLLLLYVPNYFESLILY